MKTIKPLKLGVMHRVFEDGDRFLLAVTVLVYFPFDQPQRLLPEVNLWKAVAHELGQNTVLDECMPKPNAELLVDGYAYPPGDAPQPACQVRVQLGSIDKKLYVIGNREWQRGGASDPEPFSQLAVNWDNAFGGEGYDKNPLGRGYKPIEDEESGEQTHPLPNIEHPKKLVVSPRDRPEPQGFGYIDLTWPSRQRYAGTYDNDWLKTRFPGFPEDFDFRFFQVAPEDQQLKQPFQGGEPFRIEHMHPDKAVVEGTVPKLLVRCFVTLDGPEPGGEGADENGSDAEGQHDNGPSGNSDSGPGGGELREVVMRADTLRLLPHIERGILLFRGVTEVREDDAADIRQLVIGADDVEMPRPRSHYVTVLRQRLDKDKAHLYALRDRDMLPPSAYIGEPPSDEAISDMESLLKSDRLLEKNARRKMEKELQATRDELIRHGLDPAEKGVPEALPPMEEPPDMEELPEYVEAQYKLAEQAQKDAEAKRKTELDALRTLLAKDGIDLDKALEERAKQGGGPPKLRADDELQRLRDQLQLSQNAGLKLDHIEAQLADPTLYARLKKAEEMAFDAYRRFAQHYPPAICPEEEAAQALGDKLMQHLAAGVPLHSLDFTGADLRGRDLSGAKLCGVFLEGAQLQQCNLAGADLSDAVLVRADLSGADLSGADLSRTNLASSVLADVRGAGGVECEETIFTGAHFARADFSGARLQRADLGEARFEQASFAGASADQLLFMNSDISGVSFRGARFDKCNFLEVACEGTDFAEATMESTVFLKARGAGASFRGATLTNFRVVHESAFPGADFREAKMPESNLRGSNLEGGNFAGAELTSSDFSECNLQEAVFTDAQAPQSLWIRSDLRRADLSRMNAMMAILQKANIEGASFRGANLFRVDFARIKGNVATDFDGANMKQVRFVDRGDHGQR